MGKLQDFLDKTDKADPRDKPQGVEWYAAVHCQFCGEPVDEQTLYPTEGMLVWKCASGHKSFIENYTAF